MAKRFTETGKWMDPWYRELDPVFKLAWQYVCDHCDHAGVLHLDRPLAEFQIGTKVDWDEFLEVAGGRIEALDSGKWWITGFIGFQYGYLKPDCNAHKPAFQSLEKHGLQSRVLEGYLKGTQRDQDKDKDKDKDKDTKGGVGGNELDRIESPQLRETASEWLAYKRERRESYKPTGLKSFVSRLLTLAEEHGEPAVCSAIQRGMSNGWKGFEHDIGSPGARGSPSKQRPSVDFAAIAARSAELSEGKP